MPPVLKILSLVTTILCVVLLFGIFAFDGKLHKKYENFKKEFNSTRNNSFPKKSNQLTIGTSSLETKNSSTTQTLLQVFEFRADGNYFDQYATSTGVVDQNSLERLGGNYYADKENIYYLIEKTEACEESFISKVIKLPFITPTNVLPIAAGNILRDSTTVFVYFLNIKGADPNSFSYNGIISNEAQTQNKETKYWYKDNNKVFVVTWIPDNCTGGSFTEDDGSTFKNADAATFQYVGVAHSSLDNAYAKDKNYFYTDTGILSETITPKTCQADFFKECLPRIHASTSTLPK